MVIAQILLRLLIVLGCALFGVMCLRSPLSVTRLIFKWASFWLWLGNTPLPEKGREAVFLIQHNPAEFESRFGNVLGRIKLMGAISLVIGVVTLCIVLFGN